MVAYIPTISLKISVHYIRSLLPSLTENVKPMDGLPKAMRLEAGRPVFSEMIEGFVDKTDALARERTGLSGVVVGVCGPKALADDVVKAELSVAKARKSVGGVEVVQE